MNVIKNILALIGVLSLVVIVIAAIKFQTVIKQIDTFDENAPGMYARFAEKVYLSGSAVDAMVVKVKVDEGISAQDVDVSIRSIANELNIKNVGELPLSKQVEAISGKPFRYVKIYLLCNAMTAASMLDYNDAYSSFLPCRLSVVEDKQGGLWIYTLDMDLMIHGGRPIPSALKEEAIKVRDILNEIMRRAAEGDF
ncbi:hypothetical protein MNBD_GAMMA10-1507 [hydrothermal vent metagenome]|uniref:DUF302 domain-containing protein n=1 Tax=hydrothermal vent metagenome TaxID=652676 RepID=A0A3B0YWK1_9ZZZZ